VAIQAQILDLLKDLQKKMGMSVLLITHDLGVVAEVADDAIVMYGGSIQEAGTVEEVLKEPLHPYTVGLLHSIPSIEGAGKNGEEKLNCIRGTVPNLLDLPEGCVFYPRCDCAMEICKTKRPPVVQIGEHRRVACWLHSEGGKS